MYKYIAAVVISNETKAFVRVEPFYCTAIDSGTSKNLLFLLKHKPIVEGVVQDVKILTKYGCYRRSKGRPTEGRNALYTHDLRQGSLSKAERLIQYNSLKVDRECKLYAAHPHPSMSPETLPEPIDCKFLYLWYALSKYGNGGIFYNCLL